MNKIYFGDNLEILREFESESIDLICTAPPFNSGHNYNIFMPKSKAQQKAFEDTWYWDDVAWEARRDIEERSLAGEFESVKEINQIRAIMTNTEHDEKLAVRIITDYLKEEKNIQIKKARHLTQEKEDPPDYYFEIGDHKIGCEVRHFDLVDELSKEKGINLAKEADIIDKIIKGIQQSLQETGIPPFFWTMGFITQPTEVSQNVEKIVNIITTMHKESITQSQIYEQNNPDKYYRLFIENDMSWIDILYTEPLDRVNIDEKYHCGIHTMSTRPYKTIKAEEMQAVITKKDKDIPNYKECYDQKWLIITNWETIDHFILKDAAKETQYKCNFDKVLYIQISWIEQKPRKQKRTGSLTDTSTVYELKAESGASVNQ